MRGIVKPYIIQLLIVVFGRNLWKLYKILHRRSQGSLRPFLCFDDNGAIGIHLSDRSDVVLRTSQSRSPQRTHKEPIEICWPCKLAARRVLGFINSSPGAFFGRTKLLGKKSFTNEERVGVPFLAATVTNALTVYGVT